jgi:hypothetical protein
MTARTFTLPIRAASVPSWFNALGHKQWAAPVTNTIQSVLDPMATTTNIGAASGPSGIIRAYTGALCDQSMKTVALMGNGGHDDYWGNEVYSVRLDVASPAWTRLRNATANPKSGAPSLTYPQLADGSPCSDHTGDYCVGANGKWFKCGLGSTNFNGDVKDQYWWSFDPQAATPDYTFLGSSYPVNGAGAINSTVSYDAARHRIVKSMGSVNNGIRFYSADTGALVTTIPYYITESTLTSAVDDTNGILLVFSQYTNTAYWLNLASPGTVQSFPITGTANAPADKTSKVWWHAASNAFITWDGAQGLKKLTPTVVGGAYTGIAWSSVSGGGGVTVPSNMIAALGGGMYSKTSLIKNMGDGTAALVIVPRWSAISDVWVMRLTGAV